MSSRFTPRGEVQPPPPNMGRAVFIGGTAVLASLSGLYFNMLRTKRLEEQQGTNPIHEQVLAHVNTKPPNHRDTDSLPTLSSRSRSLPMPAPKKEHNARHITMGDYNALPDSQKLGRYQVPPPQRSRGDGSGRVYTKSPDYARNYEKTNSKVVKDASGRQVWK